LKCKWGFPLENVSEVLATLWKTSYKDSMVIATHLQICYKVSEGISNFRRRYKTFFREFPAPSDHVYVRRHGILSRSVKREHLVRIRGTFIRDATMNKNTIGETFLQYH
jgi:hypothetical protein